MNNKNTLLKLLNVQKELKVPKAQYNGFGGYKFRSCEDILEAAKPHLAKNMATVLLSDEIELKGERYYVKATATFVDCETGDTMSVTACAREAEVKKGMDESQITGCASSYARKYALNGLFDIDDTKDADTMDNREDKASAQQVARIRELGCNVENILRRFKVKSLNELTSSQADFIIGTKENEQ